MLHLLDVFGELRGISKPREVWKVRSLWGIVSRKTKHYTPTVIPLLTSKTCPKIQDDSYWSSSSMNQELITGHSRMHFYVSSLWRSPLVCFQGLPVDTRVFLMFENYTPAVSVCIRTRLSGSSPSKRIVNVSLCWMWQRTPSFHFTWSWTGFGARSGQVLWKEKPSLSISPSPFIVLDFLPNHHSQYPTGASLTLNICPTLPHWWQRAG